MTETVAPPDNLRYAQKCAALGLHVFPCNPANKKALVKWRAASTSDAGQIAKWWRKWPNALPAIDLAKSNHVVIDGDRHGGPDGVTAVENLFAEHQAALTDVPAVITPTTGKHFYFRQPDSKTIGNSDKAVRGSAINIRGAGGYAIAPGTKLADGRGYSWDKNSPNFFAALRDNAIPTIPSWLIELLARPKQQSGTTAAKPNGKSSSGRYSDRHHVYAAAALDRLSAEVAGTTEGARNIVLNNAALRLGHMIASGWIERRTVEQGLIAAATAAGLDHNEVAATLKSGIEAGLKEPHPPLQDRPPRTGAEKESSTNNTGKPNIVAPANSKLPELIINESDPTATAKELAALIAETDNFLFNGYAPVRVAVEENCLPRAIEVTVEAVRVLAHEICRPIKLRRVKDKSDEEKFVTLRIPVPLSRDIALLYLNGLEGNWDLKHFRGITTAPILKNDGSLRSADGYDLQTGLWCHNIPKLEIADHPTKQHAEAALGRLRSFFGTFPFADGARIHDDTLGVDVIDRSNKPGLDESTFLAALLTAVCRQSLDLAPSYLVRGPSYSGAGTGKGLAVKALCVIGSGVSPSAFTSGHDAEEFNKRLTAALTESRPAVFLDNFNAKELKSDVLASALTEDPAMVRPMGHTKMVPLHTRTFIAMTGNAIEIAEDMARRTIVTNFDAEMEDPETRPFAPGFLEQVFASRAELLTDALTIWRWGRQTKLKPGKPLGNYERWTQWCRDPLLALGARDPVDRIAEIKAADPRRRALIAVFDAWWAAHRDNTLKTADIAPEVVELIDLKAVRRSDDSLQFNRQRVAYFLDRHAGTRVGGYALKQMKDATLMRPIAYYKLTSSRQED